MASAASCLNVNAERRRVAELLGSSAVRREVNDGAPTVCCLGFQGRDNQRRPECDHDYHLDLPEGRSRHQNGGWQLRLVNELRDYQRGRRGRGVSPEVAVEFP